MLRIFRHYLPIPTLVLGFTETVLVALAFYSAAPLVRAQYQFQNWDVAAALALVIALVAIVAMMSVGLYNSDVFLDHRLMAVRTLLALALVVPATLLTVLLLRHFVDIGPDISAMWYLRATSIWLICVIITRTAFLKISSLEIFKTPIVVLGSGSRAKSIKVMAESARTLRFVPVAFVNACSDPRHVDCLDVSFDGNGDAESLAKLVRKLRAQEIVLATDDRRGLPVHQLLECKLAGIRIVDYLDFCERETGRVDLDALRPSWFIFSDGFRTGPVTDFTKRSFDCAVSVVMLILVLPILLLTALAIKLESNGPILYRQERVGLRGRQFVLLKFRSMRVDAERDGMPQWARKRDPRVTRVGAWIRLLRIDELPQLVNVLRGDMSFVGPRPERPLFVEQIAREVPFYLERHSVKPGVTGWAQINYPYGASIEDARQKLSYDLYYLKNRGVFLDLVVLTQTVRVILWPTGAR